jgi:hypothetical protein
MKLFKKHLMVLLVLFIAINFIGCGENITKIRTKNDETAVTDNDVNDDLSDEVLTESDEDADTTEICGNEIVDKGEVCDRNVANCVDIDSSKFIGGKAKCLDDCSGFNTITCSEKEDNGNTGDTGNTGNTGDSGNTGNTGDTGNTGNTGNSGDSGNTGNTGEIITPICDSSIDSGTKDPADLAKAMELCPVSIEFPYGLQSASLTFSDGTGSGDVPEGQYAVYESFGSSIVPVSGDAFLLFSSGVVANPVSNLSVNNAKTHNAPPDWYEANGSKFPASPDCKDHDPSNNPARDSVMLTLEIKAPASANSFSFDAYFFSADYSAYVCTQFNDFFVALLDSAYSTYEPEFQNPSDKNLAVDENGNSLGINFVMSGLFTVCKLPDGEITDINKHCEGSEPLSGTGYENHGATGWLKVKGNIVPGEEFKLRLALWDSADQVLDSLVILDNWKWYKENIMPGTSK